MAKRICVTLPEEDFGFCNSRNLSPSKLLQERITQIRDEQNPILRNNLAEERKRVENLLKKIAYMSSMIEKIGTGVVAKIGEKEYDKIMDKV